MTSHFIGQSIPRVDAPGKVTGETLYPGDISMPGMLHMKIMFSSKAHARIINLDPSAAIDWPGLVCVLTAQDVPVNEYGLQITDQPVLCGPIPNPPVKNQSTPALEGPGEMVDP